MFKILPEPIPPQKQYFTLIRRFDINHVTYDIDKLKSDTVNQFLANLTKFLEENEINSEEAKIYLETNGDYYGGDLMISWEKPELNSEFQKRQAKYQKELAKYNLWKEKER